MDSVKCVNFFFFFFFLLHVSICFEQRDIAVGRGKKDYKGWRMLTAVDVKNPVCQAIVVGAHKQRGGWSLLETPFNFEAGQLCVAEGFLVINGAGVYFVDQLKIVYSAVNYHTGVAWTTMAPSTKATWDVREKPSIRAYPCLFVQVLFSPRFLCMQIVSTFSRVCRLFCSRFQLSDEEMWEEAQRKEAVLRRAAVAYVRAN